jgi:hypothetical protein
MRPPCQSGKGKMHTKQYFTREEPVAILPAFSGKWGPFAKVERGLNLSEKKLEERGYVLKYLTPEEAQSYYQRVNAQLDEQRAMELLDRAAQVALCLTCPPVPIFDGIAKLKGEPMRDAYHGCGKGTAYIQDGFVVAFHYGYARPENAPGEGCKVMLSGNEIVFV